MRPISYGPQQRRHEKPFIISGLPLQGQSGISRNCCRLAVAMELWSFTSSYLGGVRGILLDTPQPMLAECSPLPQGAIRRRFLSSRQRLALLATYLKSDVAYRKITRRSH